MSKELKRTVFLFSVIDYHAMEEYFEEMARNGWMLEKLGGITATFRKIEPVDLKFTVDIFPGSSMFESANSRSWQDYKNLCEESGWTYVAKGNNYQIYYCKAEETPIPIQTDSSIAEKIVSKTVFGPELAVMLLCLPALCTSLGGLFNFDYSRLFTNTGVVSSLLFPFLIIGLFWNMLTYVIWLVRAKLAIKKGAALPQTSVGSARFRGILLLCVSVLMVAAFLFAALGDMRNGHTYLLSVLLIPLLSIFPAVWFRKNVQSKQRSKKKNIAIFAAIVVAAGLFGMIATPFAILSSASFGDRRQTLPQGYDALTLQAFGIQNPTVSRFSKDGSFLVPQKYDYYELSPNGDVRTDYMQAIHPRLARYIFDGILKETIEKPWGDILQADPKPWGADEALYLDEYRKTIMLLKGNCVLVLESNFDFQDSAVIARCKEQLNNCFMV